MIPLGCIAKDTITGFQGVVVGHTEWLWGCVLLGLLSPTLQEGKPTDVQWFDQARVEVVEAESGKARVETKDPSGGPQAGPQPPSIRP